MDPSEALRELRACLDYWRREREPKEEPSPDVVHYMERAMELTEALDQWISAGGFLPAQWARRQKPRR